jgi:hypothetical protein
MVVDYQTHFLELINRCKGLSEKHQINIFTAFAPPCILTSS